MQRMSIRSHATLAVSNENFNPFRVYSYKNLSLKDSEALF